HHQVVDLSVLVAHAEDEGVAGRDGDVGRGDGHVAQHHVDGTDLAGARGHFGGGSGSAARYAEGSGGERRTQRGPYRPGRGSRAAVPHGGDDDRRRGSDDDDAEQQGPQEGVGVHSVSLRGRSSATQRSGSAKGRSRTASTGAPSSASTPRIMPRWMPQTMSGADSARSRNGQRCRSMPATLRRRQ